MSRVGAQKIIKNFSKGWVTEFNPIDFPENSLSEAINVVINYDGSIESRKPFTELEYSVEGGSMPIDYGRFSHIKYFMFPGDKGIVVAYLSEDLIHLKIIHERNKDAYLNVLPGGGRTFFNLDNFDITFLDNEFVFVKNISEGLPGNFIAVQRVTITKDGSLLVTSDESLGGDYTTDRFPSDGFYYVDAPGSIGGTRIRKVIDPSFIGVNVYVYINGVGAAVAKGLPSIDQSVTGLYFIHPTTGESCKIIEGSLEKVKDDTTQGVVFLSKFYSFAYTVDTPTDTTSLNNFIKYRDFRGLPDYNSDLSSEYSPFRRRANPSELTMYNLYNGGWGWKNTVKYSEETNGKTIASCDGSAAAAVYAVSGTWPNRLDNPSEFKVDTASSVEAIGLFSPKLLLESYKESPNIRKGTNILHLSREWGGINATDKNRGCFFYPDLSKKYTDIRSGSQAPTDRGLKGALSQIAQEVSKESKVDCISYIGGRMWYGVTSKAFNVLFSQIGNDRQIVADVGMEADNLGNLVRCYQENDPNDEEINQVVATDGGSLNINNIGTVKKIVEFRNYILLFSENGVWAIYGSNAFESFSPISYSVDKISSTGLYHPQGVVVGDNSVYYISKNAIHQIGVGEKNSLMSVDISTASLKRGVKDIITAFNSTNYSNMSYSSDDKRIYVNYIPQEAIDWYKERDSQLNRDNGIAPDRSILFWGTKTLVFDEVLKCFYKWEASSKQSGVTVLDFSQESLTVESIEYLGDNMRSSRVETGGLLPPSNSEFDTPLGFFSLFSGTVCLYQEVELLNKTVSVFVGNALRLNEELKIYTPSDTPEGLIDTGDLILYNSEFVIPYETFDNPEVGKSVSTVTFYQEPRADKTSRVTMISDWDLGAGPYSQELTGNVQYPVQDPTRHVPKILMNKVKIPGSGKYLSLRFLNPEDSSSTGCSFLGYTLAASIENRA